MHPYRRSCACNSSRSIKTFSSRLFSCGWANPSRIFSHRLMVARLQKYDGTIILVLFSLLGSRARNEAGRTNGDSRVRPLIYNRPFVQLSRNIRTKLHPDKLLAPGVGKKAIDGRTGHLYKECQQSSAVDRCRAHLCNPVLRSCYNGPCHHSEHVHSCSFVNRQLWQLSVGWIAFVLLLFAAPDQWRDFRHLKCPNWKGPSSRKEIGKK